jgi:diacylglycerol O-acyltransferase-1
VCNDGKKQLSLSAVLLVGESQISDLPIGLQAMSDSMSTNHDEAAIEKPQSDGTSGITLSLSAGGPSAPAPTTASTSVLPSTQKDFIAASEKILHEISDGMNNAAVTMSETFANSGKIALKVQEILKSTTESLQDEKDREIRQLKYQLKSMEILLHQNAALEKEVDRLCAELDEASMGVTKRGYLYKWRDREIYYAPKWGLRYFVLHGNKLSYYGDEHERRPRRTINLSKCYVKGEGTKKNATYHVFSIYLTETHDDSLDDTLLLKLSSDNAAEAALWVDILEQACAVKDSNEANSGSGSGADVMAMGSESISGKDYVEKTSSSSTPLGSASLTAENTEKSQQQGEPEKPVLQRTTSLDEGWGQTPIDADSPMRPTSTAPPSTDMNKDNVVVDNSITTVMMSRVQSANRILQKALSRQGLFRRTPSVHMNHPSGHFTTSGSQLSSLADVKANETSSSIAAKKAKLHRQIKAFPGYKPMHTVAVASPLSGEVRPGEYNFRGFFNLGVIILVLTHCDLIINNLSKYGFKFSLLTFLRPPEAVITSTTIPDMDSELLIHTKKALFTWIISLTLNFMLEKIASKFRINERILLFINFVIGTFNLFMPCYWVWTSKAHPGANLVYLFQSVVIWMKLVSYAHANKDLRVANRRAKLLDKENSSRQASGYSSGEDNTDNNAKPPIYTGTGGERGGDTTTLRSISEVKDLQPPFLLYPQNITVKNLLYFMVAPTLCYQLNYPRSPAIRWNKVLFLIARMIFVAIVMLFSVEQYVQPTLETALEPMNARNALGVLERLLKLSIPSTYVWLLGFYFYFHCWLNLLAEFTRFGDRLFYKDWWNAKTIDRYW